MSREAELCKIWPDSDGIIARWVCAGLGENCDWIGPNLTIGISLGGKMIAGIIFNDLRPGRDVWLSIYSTNPRWCCRRVLRAVFETAFEAMKCRRVSLFVSRGNSASISLVERLGFKKEGMLRQYRDNGEDCFVYGMLKSECKWRRGYEQEQKGEIRHDAV